ncbi:MAG TPA: hypothetical protein VE777_08410 [Gaiellales bacterium]|jgi:hypothetical protein|nr:hypothetical protein [Gaiellales bacterium]
MATSLVYDASAGEAEPLSGDAALIRARIRAPQPAGGFLDVEGHGLLVDRDGLLRRYRPVAGEAGARVELERLAAGG